MKDIQKLVVKNGLPKSHTFINAHVDKQTISSILWQEEDIINTDKQLLLYHDWSTVHFASPWYEIEADPEINETATQRDISILQNVLGEKFQPPSTIIDIHCGSGRHSIDLAKKGFRVVGMEEVTLPLELARQHAREERIPVEFVLSNRENHKNYANTADIVISMFNSLGYTFSREDDQEQFNWAVNLLKPGGYFVLDIRSYEYQKKTFSQPITTKEKLFIDQKEVATMYTTKFWQNNILGAIEKIVRDDEILQYTTYGWNTYSPDMLKTMLHKAGANLIAIYEDYYSEPKNLGERIFVVAKKM
ncbi:MAG TPA: class I SAM-dependent methyltransferase [Candidatus Saccharimonadales bacterium]|nr:class I SAM-dependent methyltransferase [Candidatus Saccharimonadales bacterium]